jgi:hypothetical protein
LNTGFSIAKQKRKLTLAGAITYNVCMAQSIWTVGPMLHFNIGGEKVRASWSVEFAYWNFNHFPYSVDFAAEFEKQKIRFYSEAQTGIGIAGISAGPVLEIQTDAGKAKLGVQGSVWGNYYLGGDLRLRGIDGHLFFAPGVYIKTGFAPKDENGNSISGSGYNGTHSHHHHHH